MAVRLEPTEHAAWSRALDASPWSSLAHWCREVVNDSLTREPIDAASGTELVDISGDEATRFVRLCGVLNERAKGSNRLGRVVADSLQSARAVADLAEELLPTVNTAVASHERTSERREKLVNVRLTDDEFGRWNDAALRGGYARVATWVRYTVAALIGYPLASATLTVPAGLDEVRRQLAGAVTNLAQLADVAEGYDAGLHEEFADVHARIADLLRRYHALGKRT
ncbi:MULTISPECIES: hypothetical protein [unclassified Rhodococcus (in: high G+C Gram-positive bacteria)]|uniref:hypothetical protein n=1 Tax=unclassified Rhodococcus (in: high G+C Gram-positive bacteria) TaxID=192944 RepID=UPI00131F5261|nr:MULTISPECIES: hypothetical protein [unclassified Rhodococcus (in: high G+C Gram-positive bacteria)]QHE74532.1 hypothetical protein GFS60_08236 [Rhodococcus sp. WAY2]